MRPVVSVAIIERRLAALRIPISCALVDSRASSKCLLGDVGQDHKCGGLSLVRHGSGGDFRNNHPAVKTTYPLHHLRIAPLPVDSPRPFFYE